MATALFWTNWTGQCIVRRNGRWAGENSCRKSTLLSLVCADNPQSYACDISLFGRKRGTGESIWEIKKHIGYVSRDASCLSQKLLPVIEIVANQTARQYRTVQTPPTGANGCMWVVDGYIRHCRLERQTFLAAFQWGATSGSVGTCFRQKILNYWFWTNRFMDWILTIVVGQKGDRSLL